MFKEHYEPDDYDEELIDADGNIIYAKKEDDVLKLSFDDFPVGVISINIDMEFLVSCLRILQG